MRPSSLAARKNLSSQKVLDNLLRFVQFILKGCGPSKFLIDLQARLQESLGLFPGLLHGSGTKYFLTLRTFISLQQCQTDLEY